MRNVLLPLVFCIASCSAAAQTDIGIQLHNSRDWTDVRRCADGSRPLCYDGYRQVFYCCPPGSSGVSACQTTGSVAAGSVVAVDVPLAASAVPACEVIEPTPGAVVGTAKLVTQGILQQTASVVTVQVLNRDAGNARTATVCCTGLR